MSEKNLYVPMSIVSVLPAMVKNELSTLSPQKQEEFLEEYRRKRKSVAVAYLFLLLIFSCHYGYMKKRGTQRLYWLTGGGFFIWTMIDLFRLPGLINEYNKEVAIEVMRNLKTISAS